MPSRRMVLGTALDTTWRLDMLSLVLVAPLIWTLGSVVFPKLVPNLAAASYWWMAGITLIGLAVSMLTIAALTLIAARAQGVPVVAATLLLIGPVVETRAVNIRGWSELWLAVVSTLAGAAIGSVFFFVFARAFGALPPLVLIGVAFVLALANWAMAAVQLLPCYPLAAGHVVRSVLGAWRDDTEWADRIARRVSYVVAFVGMAAGSCILAVGNVVVGLWGIAIGLLVLNAVRMAGEDDAAPP